MMETSPRLGLYQAEHEKVLRTFYGSEYSGHSDLLGSIAAFLEAEVVPRSAAFDAGAGGMAEVRKKLFEQGICRIPFDSHGGLSLPFGLYALAMELVGAADAPMAMSMAIHNTVAEGLH